MKLKGNVVVGPMRGKQLIEKYYFRLVGMLGYEPFKGTLDVKVEQPVDVALYATKKLEHILLDGTHKVEGHLAPIIVSAKGSDVECWALRQPDAPFEKDVLEILSKENIKEKLSLQLGDEVEITFFDPQKKKKDIPGFGIVRKLYGIEPKLKA